MEYSRITRLVDRYIGSFICFLFSLFHNLRMRPRDRIIRKVLVIELVEMGASVMAYSSLQHIRKELPGVEIYCLCLESTKQPWLLLEGMQKKHVYAIDNSSFTSFGISILKNTRALSRENIDLIIDFELFTRISAIIAFLIRAKFRAGFYRYTMEGLYRGTFYDIKCAFNQNMHIARNHLALTKASVSLSDSYYNYDGPIQVSELITPSYQSDSTLRETIQQKIRKVYRGFSGQPIILVNPTVGKLLPSRDYPKDQYVAVINELLAMYPRHLILLTGIPSHGPTAEYIHEKVGNARCLNFRGHTATIAEFLELCLISDLLISNDSGPAHFASMTPLKILALFGPETPRMYGPLGNAVCLYEFFHSSPSITAYNHKNPPDGCTHSLKIIAPARVVNMAQMLLAGKGVYRTINNEIPYLE